jgi:hypothetical protein
MNVGLSNCLLKLHRGAAVVCALSMIAAITASAQTAVSSARPPRQNLGPPIQFQSHGMDYQSLTKGGVTVMFAPLPVHVSKFNIVQATVTNGSPLSWTVRTSDFSFVRSDGSVLRAVSPDEVVGSLLHRAGRAAVIKLELLYEQSIYALSNYNPTNGYEQRREAAMAEFVNKRLKAAAEASALVFPPTRLDPGDSTDGAIFFENLTKQKNLGAGRFIAHTCGQRFVFEVYPGLKAK